MSDSEVLKLVRKLARFEAERLGSREIEPEHLLIGICKLEDPGVIELLASKDVIGSNLDQAQHEISVLIQLLVEVGLNPSVFRRTLRARLSFSPGLVARPTRSTQSRKLYDAAKALADVRSSTSTLHLLSVICASPTPLIAALLSAAGVASTDLSRRAQTEAAAVSTSQSGKIRLHTSISATPISLGPSVGSEQRQELYSNRLQLLYRLSQALASAEAEAIFEVILHYVREVIPGIDRCAILIAGIDDRLLLQAHWPAGATSLSWSWAERARRTREVFIWSIHNRTYTTLPPSVVNADGQAAIYAPMIAGGRCVGVLCVDSMTSADAFSDDDLELLRVIASYAAIMIAGQEARKEHTRLADICNRLFREIAPDLSGLFHAHSIEGNTRPIWSTGGTVLVVKLHEPQSLVLSDRAATRRQILDVLTAPLLAGSAALLRTNDNSQIIAVFGAIHDSPEQTQRGLRAGWSLVRQVLFEGWRLAVALEYGPLLQSIVVANSARPADEYTRYEMGLQASRKLTQSVDSTYYEDLLILEDRLRRNITSARLHGDSESHRSERSQIVGQLNQLLKGYGKGNFNDLCELAPGDEPVAGLLEYRAAGSLVQSTENWAALAMPGTFLIGQQARARVGSQCTVEQHPRLPVYIVTALREA